MKWVNVEDRLPDCPNQHGVVYGSGVLLTCNKWGEYEVNEYWETPKGSGWGNLDGWITHWCEITPPKKEE